MFFDGKIEEFGRGDFYESFPKIGLRGQRPTDERLLEYMGGLKILNQNQSVLDIGCNCGFLAMTVAEDVKTITGIEYNRKLVKIARKTAKLLNIRNVRFVAADYNKWRLKNKKTYDVVFSFAVHVWLKVSPQTYPKQLYQLLNSGGYLFFESNNLKTNDLNFDDYCTEFIRLGMKVVRDGKIKDDNIIERRYFIFKKK